MERYFSVVLPETFSIQLCSSGTSLAYISTRSMNSRLPLLFCAFVNWISMVYLRIAVWQVPGLGVLMLQPRKFSLTFKGIGHDVCFSIVFQARTCKSRSASAVPSRISLTFLYSTASPLLRTPGRPRSRNLWFSPSRSIYAPQKAVQPECRSRTISECYCSKTVGLNNLKQ